MNLTNQHDFQAKHRHILWKPLADMINLQEGNSIKYFTNDEKEFFNQDLNKNFEVEDRVVVNLIPSKKQTVFHNKTYFLDTMDFDVNHPLADIKKVMDIIYNHLPPKLKEVFQRIGLDAVGISSNVIDMADYLKASNYSDRAIEEFKTDPQWNAYLMKHKHGTTEIDTFSVYKRKKELERLMNMPKLSDEERSEINDIHRKELNKIQHFELTKDLKKLNEYHFKTNMMRLGISSIGIAGDVCIVFYNNQVGKILKVTSNTSTAVLELYDKAWKTKNFMTEEQKRSDMPLRELLDLEKIKFRKEKLLDRNLQKLMSVCDELKEDIHPENRKYIKTAEFILRSAHTTPETILDHINDSEKIQQICKKALDRLYKFI